MIKKQLLVLLASSSMLLASAAFAGGAASPSSPFTGVTVAAGLGVSHFHSTLSLNDSGTNVAEVNFATYNAVFSAEAGYSAAFDNQYFLGAFVTYQYSGNNGANGAVTPVDIDGYRTTSAYSLLGRLGYVFHNNVLLYAEGGVQWTRVHMNLTDRGNDTFVMNDTGGGLVWGVGIDYALSQQLSLGFEYKQTYLPTYTKNLNVTNFPDVNQIHADQDLSAFLVKLSYTFEV